MADNRSLDEFLGAEESREPAPSEPEPAVEAGAAEPGDASVDEAAEPPRETEGDDIEPMAETFAWSPAGGECDRCGESVDERWRDGEAMVCGGCKAW